MVAFPESALASQQKLLKMQGENTVHEWARLDKLK
jgi:hypothetical protein